MRFPDYSFMFGTMHYCSSSIIFTVSSIIDILLAIYSIVYRLLKVKQNWTSWEMMVERIARRILQ
jgi:hypothetical protein